MGRTWERKQGITWQQETENEGIEREKGRQSDVSGSRKEARSASLSALALTLPQRSHCHGTWSVTQIKAQTPIRNYTHLTWFQEVTLHQHTICLDLYVRRIKFRKRSSANPMEYTWTWCVFHQGQTESAVKTQLTRASDSLREWKVLNSSASALFKHFCWRCCAELVHSWRLMNVLLWEDFVPKAGFKSTDFCDVS